MKFNYSFILKIVAVIAIIALIYLSMKDFNQKENFIIGCSNNIPYSLQMNACEKIREKNPYNINPFPFHKKENLCKMIKNRDYLAAAKFYVPTKPKINCVLNRHNQRVCHWNQNQ